MIFKSYPTVEYAISHRNVRNCSPSLYKNPTCQFLKTFYHSQKLSKPSANFPNTFNSQKPFCFRAPFHQNTQMAPKKGAGSTKKGQDTRARVDRSSTPFDFSRFHIPQVRRRVISTTLITPEARRVLDSELMIQIFWSLEHTRIMGFLGFDLPRYSLERILEFFYNSKVDGEAVVSRVNGEEIRITAESL